MTDHDTHTAVRPSPDVPEPGLTRTDEEFLGILRRQATRAVMPQAGSSLGSEAYLWGEWSYQLLFRHPDELRSFRGISPNLSLARVTTVRYQNVAMSKRTWGIFEDAWLGRISNSTSSEKFRRNRVQKSLEVVFREAAGEVFEDGMESEFIRGLHASIHRFGAEAVEVVAQLVLDGKTHPQVAFEALRWLGRVVQPESHGARFSLLVSCLSNTSKWIRDGAVLGLVSMKDRRAILYLRKAIERESIDDLRSDMAKALSWMENA